MRIAIASDHRGYTAKEKVVAQMAEQGHEVEDFGCSGSASCDYPDHGIKAAECVSRGKADLGILFCGTGIGMSIAANKVNGIRASICHDELTAELARRHNDSNVLCVPADLLGEELIKRVVETWVHTPFDGGRHKRRIEKITHYEMQRCKEGKASNQPV